jgi:hypothetical protein
MIDRESKQSFWKVVEECLVQIHRLEPMEARARSTDLRKRIEHPPRGLDGDDIYHAEPFDVACDIAGNAFDIATYRKKYDSIARKYNW